MSATRDASIVAGARHFVEKSNIPVLILNIVPLENDPVFEVPSWIALRKLGSLFHHDTEKVSKVDFLFPRRVFSCCSDHLISLHQRFPPPNLLILKVFPLFPVSLHRLFVSDEFASAD